MKPKSPKPRKPSRVTKIMLGALFNLGNYEHIRYEISAEVPQGGSPKITMLALRGILAGLKPIKEPYDLERAKLVLKKEKAELTELEKDNLDHYRRLLSEHAAMLEIRKQALADLEDFGGASTRTDCKSDWDDDTPF